MRLAEANEKKRKDQVQFSITVSFGSVLQTKGKRQRGVVLEKLGGKRVPPEVITFLRGKNEKTQIRQ